MNQTMRNNSFTAFCGLLIVSSAGMCGAQHGAAGYAPQIYMGQQALRAKLWSSAGQHFRYALSWNKRGAEALSGLGFVYLGTGEPKRAVESFRAALKINPHLAEAERGVHLAVSPEEEQSAFDALTEQAKQEPKKRRRSHDLRRRTGGAQSAGGGESGSGTGPET